MKHYLSLLLAFVLLLCLCGCGESTKGQATFYYQRIEFDFGSDDGVFVPELHDVSGHENDLRYLLSLYLRGPSDQELKLPFPGGTILVELEETETELTVTLSSSAVMLDPVDLLTACGCLAKTCFAISDAAVVHIDSLPSVSGQHVDMTFSRDSILLTGNEILPDVTE